MNIDEAYVTMVNTIRAYLGMDLYQFPYKDRDP